MNTLKDLYSASRWYRNGHVALLAEDIHKASSLEARERDLERFFQQIGKDAHIQKVLSIYNESPEVLRSLFEELVDSDLNITVSGVWIPLALIANDIPLEYLLFHRQRKLVLPVEILKSFAESPQTKCIDSAQEQRRSDLSERLMKEAASKYRPRIARITVLLLIRLIPVLLALSLLDDYLIEKIVFWVVLFITASILVTSIMTLWIYRKAYGNLLLPFVRRTRTMASESQAGPVSAFPMIMMIIGIGVIAAALFLNEPWYYIGVFLCINAIAVGIGRSLPPFVLLLSSSNDQIEIFYNKIMSAIYPLWISALTQLEYKSSLTYSRLRTLRRMPDKPWMEIVESSMEMARVIVLDMRDISTHVRSEVEAVRRLGFQYKTLLIVSADAEKTNDGTEADDQATLLHREALPLTEKEALLLLRRLRRNVDDLPRMDRVLKEIVVV